MTKRPASAFACGLAAFALSLAPMACARMTAQPPAAASEPARAPARPNILLVTLDAFRAGHLSALGYPRPTTPRLDALARDGILFEQAVANGGWTLPGIGSLLTGRTPPVHRVQDSNPRLPATIPTLPGILHEAGYYAPALFPWYRGRGFGFDSSGDATESSLYYESPAGEKYVKAAVWIETHRDRPFFLWIHDPDTHLPYEPAAESLRIFEPVPYGGPPVEGSKQTALALASGALKLDAAQTAHLVNLYDAGLREADSNLAGFLDGLARGGILDSTIVVVTADHGEEILDHGQLGHAWWTYRGNLHDETVRIPWIVWGARAGGRPIRGVRIADQVQQADLMPTLLALVGLPVPGGIEGMSLVPAIEAAVAGKPSPLPPERPVFAESSPAGFYAVPEVMGQVWLRSVRLPPWKLIVEQGVLETRAALYDLARDPGETRDVSADHPEEAARLRALLADWIRASRAASFEHRAPGLPPEAPPGLEGATRRP